MIDAAEWARCAGYIEDALEYADGTHTLDDVRAGIEAGRFLLWTGPHSAVITEIVQYPQLRALNFFLAGGRLEELEIMLPLMLQWGKTQGCTRATLTGRPGWSRSFLTKYGWTNRSVTLGANIDV